MKRTKAYGSKGQQPYQHGGKGVGTTNGYQRWLALDGKRSGLLRRFETYASVTIPKVCLPDNVDENSNSIQHDWTSVGAQAVNHLTNKVCMALFPVGVPFFRLDPNKSLKTQMAAAGLAEATVRDALVAGEAEASQIMDQKAIRPKLFEAVRNLIVVGNILLDLIDVDNPRTVGIRDYVVKRSMSGQVQEILHRERLLWNELTPKVQAVVNCRAGEDGFVDYVRWFCRGPDGKWVMRVSVDGHDLGDTFSQNWTSDRFPVYPLTWDLADKHNYGTGLVEDYAGDFGTLSTLSESEVKAAILASDFRWLADPAGTGDIEEFKRSQTGDVIPGKQGDLSLVSAVGAQNLQAIAASADRVINRIGRGFLLGTAVTRNAERVTAEEIRMNAVELETSLGGVYSRLSVDMQLPLATWLLRQIDVEINGTDLVPTVVSGLAALSRSGEAQQLGAFLGSLSGVGNLHPLVLQRLKLSDVISTLAAAYGISASKYIKDEETVAEESQAAAQAQMEQDATTAAVEAGAERLSKEPT